MKVALLGLGAMGSQMLQRLAESGVEVTGWNRSPARAELPGERIAPSATEAVRGADLVITMLADGSAVREVLDQAAPQPGTLVVDMSTIGPEASREIASVSADRSVRFLEAPVSGSVGAARRGTLTIMTGGSPEDAAEAEGVLQHLGTRVVHIGPAGTAATLKLCVNALLHTFNTTLGQVLGVAERAGIARETAYDVIGVSAVAAPFVAYKREAFLAEELPPVAFTVDLVRKDLGLFLDAVANPEQNVSAVGAAMAVVERAGQTGLGGEDMAAIARLFRP